MRFLLLGDHPDGVAAALALAATGRHEFAAYAGPANALARFRQAGHTVAAFDDAETALAQRGLELAIIADELEHRPALLKRALQSELHVAVVHPPDLEPDIAYEALLIQEDVKRLLIPLLPDRTTPGLAALRAASASVGGVQQVEMEVRFPAPLLRGGMVKNLPREWEGHPLLTLWEPLRFLAGEVQDLTVVTPAEELGPAAALVVTGRYHGGALLQAMLTPQPQGVASCRLLVRGDGGEAHLDAPQGLFAPTRMRTNDTTEEIDAPAERGALLATVVEAALDGKPTVTWTDATRCLELFDAARRSVRRKRLIALDYDAVSETGNFKSTMTALGCGVLLLVMALFFATPSFPALKWLIPPILAIYLLLQLLRWVAKDAPPERPPSPQ